MFKVVRNPEFTHDVPVHVPVDDGFEEQVLRTRFRALTMDELAQHEFASPEGQQAFLRNVVVGFGDLVDDEGKGVTCTAELRDQLLAYPYIQTALIRTYQLALIGGRLGN